MGELVQEMEDGGVWQAANREHRGLAQHALRALGDGSGLAQNQLHAFQAGSHPERGFYSSRHRPAALDARVVAAAYRSHGERLLEELDGPFSLALWERRANRLLLARDKLGEKSLYYHFDPGQETLVFATEIKCLTAHPGVPTELDLDSLPLHFAFGYIPGRGTLFRGVKKLLPGECLSLEPGRAPKLEKYYRLPAITDGHLDEEYCQRRLRELFLTALERSPSAAARTLPSS